MEKSDSALVTLVQNLKGTVTLMINVKKVLDVDQTIAWLPLDLMPTQIAVMKQLLEMMIFVQLMNLVKWMKVTVIPMMNAKVICFVDQTTVHFHFFKNQMTALVFVDFQIIKVMTIVTMKIIIVDAKGMEETVVVVMSTQIIVQLVNA